MIEVVDKHGKLLQLRDFEANEVVGVQIGTRGHKLWVCVDGVAVLRVKAPVIDLEDMRRQTVTDRVQCFTQQNLRSRFSLPTCDWMWTAFSHNLVKNFTQEDLECIDG